jgi:hypothetical protein
MVHFACMPSLIPRQVCWNLFARTVPPTSAFPEIGAGRLLHQRFRGLLSVYSRYGLHARQVAFATLYTRGFNSFVAFTAAVIATGWSEPVPGRVYPRCGPAPFTAHPRIPFERAQTPSPNFTPSRKRASDKALTFMRTWQTGSRWFSRSWRTYFFPVGTFCFSSSNQFRTTLICVGAACDSSTGFSIRNRWPSGETS